MNKHNLILMLSAIILFAACANEADKETDNDINPSLIIAKGFTFENFPKIDGSTSTEPLNIILVCKLLGIKYEWLEGSYGRWYVEPIIKNVVNSMKFWRLIKTSQTHQSFINLIDKDADIILTARKMSPDEKAYADSKGAALIETPVALDSFIFIINPDNQITTLTLEQVRDIYTGKIKKWNEVGGNNEDIIPYIRNQNSGSQELMESLVMKDLVFGEYSVSPEIISSMVPVFELVQNRRTSICYTVFYFKEYILRDWGVKTIAINGIHPTKETIANETYPLNAEVYAVIRSDLDQESTAYKLYELLQSETGKEVIKESGYVPY